MADNTTSSSQSQQTPATFVAHLFDEASRAQAQFQETMAGQIDQMANLMKSSLKYQAEMTGEMRKLAVDSAKKAAELFTSAR